MKAFMNLLAFLLFSVPLFADSIVDPSLSVKAVGEKAFSLEVSNAINEEVMVSIMDDQGNLVYSHLFKNEEDIARTYNLSKLTDGDYTLKVEKDLQVWVQPMTYRNNLVQVSEQALKTRFKPSIRTNEGLVDFDLLCPVNAEVRINIVDQSDRTLYTETLDVEGALQKRFDISQLVSGSYYMNVQISEGDDTLGYTETIRIEK